MLAIQSKTARDELLHARILRIGMRRGGRRHQCRKRHEANGRAGNTCAEQLPVEVRHFGVAPGLDQLTGAALRVARRIATRSLAGARTWPTSPAGSGTGSIASSLKVKVITFDRPSVTVWAIGSADTSKLVICADGCSRS